MPQSPSLRRWCGECTKQASCITKRWKNLENSLFLSFFDEVNWNKSKAARLLGMHRSTLVRKLRELHIDIRALRNAERRPPHGIRTHQQNRNVGWRLWKRISRSFVSGLPQNLKEEI